MLGSSILAHFNHVVISSVGSTVAPSIASINSTVYVVSSVTSTSTSYVLLKLSVADTLYVPTE